MIRIPLIWRLVALLIIIFIIINIIGLLILSSLVVLVTYLISLKMGISYYELCDRSDLLYKLNYIGKYSILSLVCILIFKLFFIR